jgi:uncharacterized protein YdaU (DUF1376 family)
LKVNFFSLHIGDFLGGTMGFDAQELGAYTSLLIAHYQAGQEGLRDDDIFLARVARVSSKVWKRIKDRVLEKFILDDGLWIHNRVVEELRKMTELSSQNSEKSLKRWNSRKPKALQGQSNPITNSQVEKKLVFEGDVIRLNQKDFDTLLSKSGLSEKGFVEFLDDKDKWYATLAEHKQKQWWHMLNAAIEKLNTGA